MSQQSFSRRAIIGTFATILPLPALAQNGLPNQLRDLLNPAPGQAPGNGAAGAKPAGGSSLSQNEIGLGLKDALKVASQRVVGRLGKMDGYNGDPAIRIPLPDSLQRIEAPLRTIGANGLLDDLHVKMNRAAEQAAPKAFNIFADAATKMSFDDARMILTGPQDSATQYFRRTTSNALTSSFRPIVDGSLSNVGAVVALNTVQTRARSLPFVGQMLGDFNLTDFTVGKALDGLFHYLAVEEAAIRTNPVARTTNLLKKIFG